MQDFLQGFQAGAPGILPMLKEPALLEACGILFQDGKDKDAVLFRKGEDLWQEGAALCCVICATGGECRIRHRIGFLRKIQQRLVCKAYKRGDPVPVFRMMEQTASGCCLLVLSKRGVSLYVLFPDQNRIHGISQIDQIRYQTTLIYNESKKDAMTNGRELGQTRIQSSSRTQITDRYDDLFPCPEEPCFSGSGTVIRMSSKSFGSSCFSACSIFGVLREIFA